MDGQTLNIILSMMLPALVFLGFCVWVDKQPTIEDMAEKHK